jgi:hypothetical protein
MSTSFDAMAATDAQFMSADVAGPNEPITFIDKTGAETPLIAVVNRQPIEPFPGPVRGARRWHFIVFIPAGIGITKVNRSADRIRLPDQPGSQNMIDMRVEEVLSQDSGGWLLRLD